MLFFNEGGAGAFWLTGTFDVFKLIIGDSHEEDVRILYPTSSCGVLKLLVYTNRYEDIKFLDQVTF